MNTSRRQTLVAPRSRPGRFPLRVVRPVIVRPQPQKIQKKLKPKNKTYNDVMDDIINSFVLALNRPIVLVVLLCVVAVVYTHHTQFDTGVIGQWIKKNHNNALAIWIKDNSMKFLGLLIFLPTVLDSPQKVQPLLFGASFFWVLLVPEASIYEYVVQSIALHTYFRVKLQKSRLVIILFVVFVYFAGFWTLPVRKL
nr:hypothetical protein 2 [ssRNA positive-strand virus sp.]